MYITYSQYGQDISVSRILRNKFNGYFLDIGSSHPKKFSNTYLLEKNLSGADYVLIQLIIPSYIKRKGLAYS